MHTRQRVARMHHVFDAHQFFPQLAAGMQCRKVSRGKSAALEQGDGQCVAHGHRRGSARGRRQVERASFFLHADVKQDIARGRQRRARVPGQSDERNAQPLDGIEQRDDLLGFAAVGDSQQHVFTHQHPQIPMVRLRRMQKQ